jgi:hypothetical protein
MSTLWPWRWRIAYVFIMTALVMFMLDRIFFSSEPQDWFGSAWWTAFGFMWGIIESSPLRPSRAEGR